MQRPGNYPDNWEKEMRKTMLTVALGATILGAAWPAAAQGVKPGGGDSPAANTAIAGMSALKGNWVRPDGGYMIVIKNVAPDGQLEAMYFNPNPLPFARAQAMQEGTKLRLAFELRAGGYGGSTYELTYDAAADRLKGTYYQAIAKQHYEIFFIRK